MTDIKEYKRISIEFRRYASNLLNTDYTNFKAPLYRFKKYIDTQTIINEIIEKKIKNLEFDYRKCFIITGNSWSDIKVPIDEKEHIKAMYDFMTYIVDNEMNILGMANSFSCSSRNITDILRNFLSKSFKSLIDFIVSELAKEIILLEDENMGININGNSGNINLANNNSVVNATNNINNAKEIVELANQLKEIILKEKIEEIYKENIIDDIDIITEQVENSIPKPTRFRKALENIKNFLKSPQVIALETVAIQNIDKFVTLLQGLIN